MPKKIVCTLPNASEYISGIEFELTEEGAVSKQIVADKDAARFEKIPGYHLVEAEDDSGNDASGESSGSGSKKSSSTKKSTTSGGGNS